MTGTRDEGREGLALVASLVPRSGRFAMNLPFDPDEVSRRLFVWSDDPRSSRAEKQLWPWAEALTSEDSPHDYAQAIMDLGATLCTPREPECGKCPLQEICQACEKGLTATLPIARKKQKIPVRQQVALILCGSGGVLLQQRPAEGFLGGLWEFPTADLSSGQEPEQAATRLLSDLGVCGELSKAGEIRHAYSHFKLELTAFRVDVDPVGIGSESSTNRWCSGNELESLSLHGAHRKAYNKFNTDR